MFIFRFNDGLGTWRDVPVEGEITVGRSPGNTIQVSDSGVSGSHLKLYLGPRGIWLTDLGSTNGTIIGGQRIPPQVPWQIYPGQEIWMGGILFVVLQPAPAASAAPLQPGAGYPTPPPAYNPAPPLPPQMPPPAVYPPGPPAYSYPPTTPPQPAKKRLPLAAILAGGALLLLLVIAALLSGEPTLPAGPDQTPGSTRPVSAPTGESVLAKADGQVVLNSEKVGLSVAPGSLLEASAVRLVAVQPEAAVDQFLKDSGLSRKSAIYRLEMDGSGDSKPYQTLSFPASGPGDSVIELVNGNLMVWADANLVDNRLVVKAFVGLAGAWAQAAAVPQEVPPQYMLISKSSAFRSIPGLAQAAGIHPVLSNLTHRLPVPLAAAKSNCTEEETYYKNGQGAFRTVSVPYCRWSPGDRIKIIVAESEMSYADWLSNLGKIDAYIDKIANLRTIYAGSPFGFKVAAPGQDWWIKIHVGPDGPDYNPISGWIHIPTADVTTPTDASDYALAHEIFHWIEHDSYYLRTYWRNTTPARWWVDVAAEMAPFMIDPKYQHVELLFKGTASNNGQRGIEGWLEEPFKWTSGEESRYIHAQQLYTLVGESCLMTRAEFVNHIKQGNFPLDQAAARTTYRLGSSLLAKYLLNDRSGTSCNPTMKMDGPLASGIGYGNFIHASRDDPLYPGNIIHQFYLTNAMATTQNITPNPDTREAAITASIPPGGVFPLRVSNGASVPTTDNLVKQRPGIDEPSVPYALLINPGASFYYTTGDGKIIPNDGTQPLVLSPITSETSVKVKDDKGKLVDTPGIALVRLTAYNRDDKTPATFAALFTPLPPLVSSVPMAVDLKNGSVEIPIQIKVDRVERGFQFNAQVDYGDGSPLELVAMTGGPDLKATINLKHKFLRTTIKEIVVTFVTAAKKPILNWDMLKIPVISSPAPGPAPLSGTSWVRIELSAPSNPWIGAGSQSLLLPVTWSGGSAFTQGGGADVYHQLTGSVGPAGLTLTIVYPDLVGTKARCPHSIRLVNIPRVSESYLVFSTEAPTLTGTTDIGPYISKIETLDQKIDQCYAGSIGAAPRSTSFFRVTFCNNKTCS